jgi:hypothetical protein
VANEDNDNTYIRDSFNQDNDGVDNSHGHITDSVVAGDDISHSLNTDDDVDINDSYNHVNTEINTDASDDDTYTDSFNGNSQDNDGLDLDLGDIDVHVVDF